MKTGIQCSISFNQSSDSPSLLSSAPGGLDSSDSVSGRLDSSDSPSSIWYKIMFHNALSLYS